MLITLRIHSIFILIYDYVIVALKTIFFDFVLHR